MVANCHMHHVTGTLQDDADYAYDDWTTELFDWVTRKQTKQRNEDEDDDFTSANVSEHELRRLMEGANTYRTAGGGKIKPVKTAAAI